MRKIRKILIQVLITGALLHGTAARAADSMWQLVHSQRDGLAYRSSTAVADLPLMPEQYQMYRIDESTMLRYFEDGGESFTLDVPLPDGALIKLNLTRSSVLEEALAEQRPDIMTFEAVAETDRRIRGTFDYSPKGFHGLFTTAEGTVYIDPRGPFHDRYYISYYRKDYRPGEKSGAASCGVDPMIHFQEKAAPSLTTRFARELAAAFTTGDRLREYRIAVAATAEYTAFHADSAGTAVDDTLNAIVTTINRVNFFLRRDFSAKLNVVANNRDIIFTDTNTDGFTHNNPGQQLNEVTPIIDGAIGRNNYDIGHVFDTLDAGPFSFVASGIAYVGVVCDPRTGINRKAQGASASSNPIGDSFDVELVAHEIGHQFGASHTFNSTRGSCGGGARSAGNAVEPGSGSTIMSYPGSCGSDNLQSGPDYMFSSRSMEQVADEFNNGWGDICDVATNEGNSEPSAFASGTYSIPAHTPFELTGSGVDTDGDALTYSWEQVDSGNVSSVNVDTGNNAIFRAFLPVSTPTRVFPKLSSILSNSSSLGEVLPTTTRELNFRLTVRDQRGGTDDANVVVNVTDTSTNGFRISSQNSAQELVAGSDIAFTWDVAGTNAAPISCSSVDILFSSDGGQTFPTPVLSGTSNDGAATVTVPAVLTTQGRFKLKCAGNIFFDINDANVSIGNVPEIRINGNGQEINDGSTGVSSANDTLFGTISPVSNGQGFIDKTFQIQNLGTETLLINGSPRVTISGSNNFSVTDFPASSIASSGSDTFTIRFSSATIGTSNATVQILSNDGDESPYTFAIRGVVAGPEMSILGNNRLIADGDSSPTTLDGTNFGNVNVNDTDDNIFTVRNAGAGLLELTNTPRIVIGGTHAGDFSVVENADQFTDQSNTTNHFTIRFRPTAAGVRNATVSISNNDSDNDPYNFSIRGAGVAADLTPILLDNPDSVNPGESLSYTITVNNNGPYSAQNVLATLSAGSQVSIVSTSGCTESPAATSSCSLGSIPSNGSAVFTVNTTVGVAARNSVTSSVSVTSQTPDLIAGNNSDSESTTVALVAPQLAISAQPSPVLQNDSSTIVLTVNNTASNVTATGVGVTVNLPSSLLVADAPNSSSTCGGSLVANPGTTQINFSNGAVNASQNCTIRFDVAAEEVGSYVIQTSLLTSSSGNGGAVNLTHDVVEKLEDELCVPIQSESGQLVLICL
ncbi:MAG: choice-of-anchor D domain-containing protein [Acidiferrobacterales bacterium]|nr:choice-of-anchor D domain-containing protein [Acidiferrobacterales bacterium]